MNWLTINNFFLFPGDALPDFKQVIVYLHCPRSFDMLLFLSTVTSIINMDKDPVPLATLHVHARRGRILQIMRLPFLFQTLLFPSCSCDVVSELDRHFWQFWHWGVLMVYSNGTQSTFTEVKASLDCWLWHRQSLAPGRYLWSGRLLWSSISLFCFFHKKKIQLEFLGSGTTIYLFLLNFVYSNLIYYDTKRLSFFD